MKKSISVIIWINLLLCSCTFTHKKSEGISLYEYYDKINILGKNNIAQINRLEGKTLSLYNILISVDSISGPMVKSDSMIILKTMDVHSITYHNHLKGTVGGFAIGFALSLTARLLQYTFWTPKETGEGAWPIIKFMYVPLIGAGIGSVVGAIISEKDEYIIIDKGQ